MTDRPDRPTPPSGSPSADRGDWADLPLDREDRGQTPIFLGRGIYRRRRIMDAARLLPAFGAVFVLLPALWAPGLGTVPASVYLFLLWFGLILVAAGLSRRLSEPLRQEPDDRHDSEGR